MLPLPCFTVGMILGRWWVEPGFFSRHDAYNWGQTVKSWFHQTTESCFSQSLELLEMLFLQTPSRRSCAFHWGEPSIWPLCHEAQIGAVLQWWLSSLKFFLSPHRISGALPEWPSGSWSPLLPRPFSRDFSVWRPALGRVLVVQKCIPFKNYGGHCALGNL